jgi:hypothetical protein
MPPVTTSVPAAEKSLPYLIEKLTLGDVPATIEHIFVNVIDCVLKNKGNFSAAPGLMIVMDLGAAEP